MSIEQQIHTALSGVIDPNTGKDLAATKSIRNLRIDPLADGVSVSLDVELGYPANSQLDTIRSAVIGALRAVPGVANVSVHVNSKIVAHVVQRGAKTMANVRNIIAVASGKGGVGKSTTAVNLALALAAEGATVGILEPTSTGRRSRRCSASPASPNPATARRWSRWNATVSRRSRIGFMIDPDEPMVWRGPIVTQALTQLLEQTNWRDLDYLVVDMPPGTRRHPADAVAEGSGDRRGHRHDAAGTSHCSMHGRACGCSRRSASRSSASSRT